MENVCGVFWVGGAHVFSVAHFRGEFCRRPIAQTAVRSGSLQSKRQSTILHSSTRVDEPLIGQCASALLVSLFCRSENPEILDLFLIRHEVPLNFVPRDVGLSNTVSSSQLGGLIEQAQLVKLHLLQRSLRIN